MADGDFEISGAVSEGRLSSMIQKGGLLKGLFGESRTTAPAEVAQPATGEVTAQPESTEVVDPGSPAETTVEPEAQAALDSLQSGEQAEEPAAGETQSFPENVQKRIDQLTAQKHEARERAERAELELTTLKKQLEDQGNQQPVRVENDQDPLAGIYKIEDLAATEAQLEELEQWCINNPEGGNMPLANGKTEFVDAVKVRSWQADAAKMLRKGIPERRGYIANHAAVAQEVGKKYPDMYKPGTEMNQFVINSVKAMPHITKFWDWPKIMAWTYNGMKADLAQEAALKAASSRPAKPAAQPSKKAPVVNSPASASVGKVNSSQKAVSESAQKYIERGGTKNLAALLRSGGLV